MPKLPMWSSEAYFTSVLYLLFDTLRTLGVSQENLAHHYVAVVHTHGLQINRESLYEREIPLDIADVNMLSSQNSTRQQYEVYIKRWIFFCSEKSADPMHCEYVVTISTFRYI